MAKALREAREALVDANRRIYRLNDENRVYRKWASGLTNFSRTLVGHYVVKGCIMPIKFLDYACPTARCGS